MKFKQEKNGIQEEESEPDSAPSPKFVTLSEEEIKSSMPHDINQEIIINHDISHQIQDRIPESQLKTFNDVTNAE